MTTQGDTNPQVEARAQIWLIACAFPPVGRGNSITNGCIAQELSREFEVTVVAIEEAKGLLLSYNADKSLLSEGLKGLHVQRFPAPNWLGLNEVLYGIGLLPCYYLNWALRVWRRRAEIVGKPAAIVGIYPVFSDLVVAYLLSRAFGVPLIVDFRDDLAGVMSRGWRKIYGPFYRKLERSLVHAAARVTVTTEELADDLAERHRASRSHFRVLSNIVPESLAANRQLGDERESSSGVTVVYAGAMSAVQRPEVLLLAYRQLLSRRPDLAGRVTVEICGPRNRYFRRKVEPCGIPGVQFRGFLPRAEVDEMMARADVGYLCLSDATFAYATPTKLFDYIEYGLPVLGALPQGAARRLVEERELGFVCDDGDIDGVARGLERFCDDTQFRQQCQERLAKERHSFSITTQGPLWRTAVREVVETETN